MSSSNKRRIIPVIKNKISTKLEFDYISRPPMEAVEIYENMKTDFTSKLNQEIEDKLDNLVKALEDIWEG